LIHTVETSMTSLAQEQQDELKSLIEQLKMSVNGNDKSAIEMRQKALQDTYSNMMQAEQAQQKSQPQGEQYQEHAANDSAKDDDIIDAEFEDVSNG